VNLFKRKQLSRVIESIGRAANFLDEEINEKIEVYTSYDNYEKSLKDLTYELYKRFYIEDETLCNYSLDMIKNIGFNYFTSQEEMIKYASRRLNRKTKNNECLKEKHKKINKSLKISKK
jgi:regulator of sigma D